jgi:hypothetical protein
MLGVLATKGLQSPLEAVKRAAHARRDAAIDQLPPSAWRKITIKPKELIAKYQHRMPAGQSREAISFLRFQST